MPFTACPQGVRVRVRVTPKAARDGLQGLYRAPDGGTALKVSLMAPPSDGKANAALLKLLSKMWSIPRSRMTIAVGAGDRNKTILITGIPSELMARLSEWWSASGRTSLSKACA